jgi:hypothetical protein
MLFELGLGVAELANDIPESIRNQSVSMLLLEELEPVLLLFFGDSLLNNWWEGAITTILSLLHLQ